MMRVHMCVGARWGKVVGEGKKDKGKKKEKSSFFILVRRKSA